MSRDINGYELCNGCGVCTLPCPVWQQSHDAFLTFKGRARALQGGAGSDDIKESVAACLLCGSCEPACAMGVRTVDITLQLRSRLNENNIDLPTALPAGTSSGTSILLPDDALRKRNDLIDRITSRIAVAVADDGGSDILGDFENGRTPVTDRLRSFLQELAGYRRIIVTDGLFKRLLRGLLPWIEITGIGETLLRLTDVQEALKPTDLYLIESRSYNTDFDRCMPFYTDISRKSGCAMNLDLQRIAIPTGSHFNKDTDRSFQTTADRQIRWILEGRSFDRVVVESVDDMELLNKSGGMYVVHASELVEMKKDE
jgi:ferredoxin